MTGKDIIKEILVLRKWSQSKLAEKIGKSQTNVTGYLNRGKNEMRLDVFVEMATAMDCEVIVKSTLDDKAEWVITSGNTLKPKIDLDALLSDEKERENNDY